MGMLPAFLIPCCQNEKTFSLTMKMFLRWKFWEKNPLVHLIIVREWPREKQLPPPILRNLDNFSFGASYSTLLPAFLQSGIKEYVKSFRWWFLVLCILCVFSSNFLSGGVFFLCGVSVHYLSEYLVHLSFLVVFSMIRSRWTI